jgi:hypothetical protein
MHLAKMFAFAAVAAAAPALHPCFSSLSSFFFLFREFETGNEKPVLAFKNRAKECLKGRNDQSLEYAYARPLPPCSFWSLASCHSVHSQNQQPERLSDEMASSLHIENVHRRPWQTHGGNRSRWRK